jgi:hypothetical protein
MIHMLVSDRKIRRRNSSINQKKTFESISRNQTVVHSRKSTKRSLSTTKKTTDRTTLEKVLEIDSHLSTYQNMPIAKLDVVVIEYKTTELLIIYVVVYQHLISMTIQ